VASVGDKVSRKTLEEKIDEFAKNGSLFLFVELMSLRRELERLKEELASLRDDDLIYVKR